MQLLNQLTHPTREFTPIPFWFLNGELTDGEIRRQLTDFATHGVYGVVLHPRMGLAKRIEYLSSTYFHYIRTAVQTAAELPPPEPNYALGKEIFLPLTFRYKLNEPNVCVLDRAAVTVSGQEPLPEQDVLMADNALRDLLELPYRKRGMLQLWYQEKFRRQFQGLARTDYGGVYCGCGGSVLRRHARRGGFGTPAQRHHKQNTPGADKLWSLDRCLL